MLKLAKYLPDFSLVAIAAIWGSTYVVVKANLSGVHALTLLCYQSVIAIGILLLLLIYLRKNPLENWHRGVCLGLVQSLFYLGEAMCLYYTSATNAAFITGLFTVIIPVYSFCFLKTKPTPNLLLAIVFSIIGLWLITGGIAQLNLGDLLVLGSTFIGALRIFLAHRFLQQQSHPLVLVFQQLLVLALVSSAVVAIFHLPLRLTTNSAIYALIYLAIFATFACYVIQSYVLTIVSPVRVSMINTLVPVFGAVFAWTVGHEAFVWQKMVGGMTILIAILLVKVPAWVKK